MSAASSRSGRLVRRTIGSVSRRGLQFVRRASLGGVVAASVFAAAEAQAQVNIPPDASGTATGVAGSSSFGNQTITFTAPGTLSLSGSGGTVVNNALEVRWFDTEFGAGLLNPIANLINSTSEGSGTLTTGTLNYNGDAAFNAVVTGLTNLETFSGLWTGFMNITAAGNHVFQTQSDDGSVFWIDVNRNGVFDGNELVVNNNGDHGDVTVTSPNVNLGVGNYRIAIGFYENGGGNIMRAAFRRPSDGTTNVNINPSAAGQAGLWSYVQNPTDTANFSTNPVVMNANGTITVDTIQTGRATIGPLSMAPGVTLTENGVLETPSTTVTGAGTATFNVGGFMIGGPLSTSGGAVAVTKSGAGLLSLASSTNVAAGSSFNVSAGTLEITNSPTGVTSIGGSPINLTGGTLSVVSVGVESGAPQPGWLGKFYNLAAGSGSDASLALLDSLTPVASTVVPAVNFDDGQANLNPFAGIGVTVTLDDHAARFTGKINITAADNYTFETTSDDGSVLWLDANNDGDFNDAGEEIVNNRGLHGPQIRTGTIALTPGDYRLKVDFFERGGGSQIIARYGQGANPTAVIPQSVMSTVLEVAPDYQSNVNVTENSTITTSGTGGIPLFGDLTIAATKNLTVAGMCAV